jgi:hypothetical protein
MILPCRRIEGSALPYRIGISDDLQVAVQKKAMDFSPKDGNSSRDKGCRPHAVVQYTKGRGVSLERPSAAESPITVQKCRGRGICGIMQPRRQGDEQ